MNVGAHREVCEGCNVAFVSHRGRQGGFRLSNLFTQSSRVGTGGDGGASSEMEVASSERTFLPAHSAVQSDGYPKAPSAHRPLRSIPVEVSCVGLVWGFVLVVFSDLALSPLKVPQGLYAEFT